MPRFSCSMELRVVLALITCWCGTTRAIWAQSAKAVNPPLTPPTPKAAAPSVEFSDVEAVKKGELLRSDRWKEIQKQFDQWMAVQVVYTPQQVEQLKAKLAAEVQSMTAAEFEQFLDQWSAKLKLLLGKDADEARQWLGQYLSVMANGYRREFLQKLGVNNVVNMTAAQLEDELNKLRAQRMGLQQQRAAFDIGRQHNVQVAQQFHEDQKSILQQSGVGQAGEFGTFQTQFGPRQYNYSPLPPIIPFFW
jgi:NADH dehydrogenase/NADH:ubiquinone oxidoreductase subunit G